ncbi:hypothetical protein [Paenibacillus residui]|uniref:Uncharacterized protein n=1 Tax=Paenibacillus residui TaxID=629724 RepID=A0ABW3D8U3_9BACL
MKARDHGQEREREEGKHRDELFRRDMEVDSDVNEDRNRENLLDASFEAWYENIEYWVKQKDEMTRVPEENVFEAAEDMDAEEEQD